MRSLLPALAYSKAAPGALTRAGRLDEAQLAFEKMLTYANHVGLCSEDNRAARRGASQLPQAFTHLALISCAFNLDRALG